ncbi:MAG TPA: hypothetical protein VGM72_06460 [Micropepsaceae bacterium]|jgi:uncharacterized protein YcfJ
MRKIATKIAAMGAAVLVAGCAMAPRGPTVRVFPPPYKPFEVFQQDQDMCEDYAHSQTAGDAEAANSRAVGTAAIGTALGLALGAATGSGRAASFGAAGGAAVGGTIGANQSERANFSLQRRYDIAYAQCMYAKGNQVPGFGRSAPPPLPPGGPDGPPPRRE